MKHTPRSEEEIKKDMVPPTLPDGDYSFEILSAKDGVSNANNPQITLSLRVWGPGGVESIVTDWLLTENPRAEYKYRHACFAVTPSLAEYYENGEVPAELFIGKTGKLHLTFKKGVGTYTSKKDGKEYDKQDQNFVKDYIVGGKSDEKDEYPF